MVKWFNLKNLNLLNRDRIIVKNKVYKTYPNPGIVLEFHTIIVIYKKGSKKLATLNTCVLSDSCKFSPMDIGLKICEINHISVEPDYRDSGIGSELMRVYLEYLKRKKIAQKIYVQAKRDMRTLLYYGMHDFQHFHGNVMVRILDEKQRN